MKTLLQKIKAIHILCYGAGVITCIIIYFLFVKKDPQPLPYDEKFIQLRTDSLRHEIITLQNELKKTDAIIISRDRRYDSLEATKTIIKTIYANKDKEIDAAHVSGTITDLNRIFTENGIK